MAYLPSEVYYIFFLFLIRTIIILLNYFMLIHVKKYLLKRNHKFEF